MYDKTTIRFDFCDIRNNHNYNKILKSDWFSTALISALIGQFNRTVSVMPHSYDYRPNWTPLSPVTITNQGLAVSVVSLGLRLG